MKIKRFGQINEDNSESNTSINKPDFSLIEVENMFYELKDDYNIDFKVEHCYYGKENSTLFGDNHVVTKEESRHLIHAFKIKFKLEYEMADSIKFFDVDFMKYIITLCQDKAMEFKFGIKDSTCYILLLLNQVDGESNINGINAANDFYEYLSELENSEKYLFRKKPLLTVVTSTGGNNVYIKFEDLSKATPLIVAIDSVSGESSYLDATKADKNVADKLKEICKKYGVKVVSKSNLRNNYLSIYFVD